MRSWLLATRPKTLPAAVAPVAAGTVLGGKLQGVWRWDFAWWALASCLALQIATNLFNDAIDHAKGADTEKRLGPRRVTASGDLRAGQVLVGAFLFLLVAGLTALPLWLAHGWPILVIGIPSLLLCYAYTGGPFPLAYLGLGDLFVLIFFGWVAVVGSCFLQTGQADVEALLLGTQIGLLSTALIAINNLRDVEEDRGTGKRTLAVRLGVRWAKAEIVLCLLGPSFLGIVWWVWGWSLTALWPLVASPFAVWIAWQVLHAPPSRRYNQYLALGGVHLLIFAGVIIAGLLQD